MIPLLRPCASCARHIRASEAACPFCGAAAAPDASVLARKPAMSGRPMSRAALLFASAATALACSSSGSDNGASGAPPVHDAGGAQEDAGPDAAGEGNPVVLYGPAPMDDAGGDADARADVDASDADATDAEAPDASTTYDAGNVPVVYGPPPIGG